MRAGGLPGRVHLLMEAEQMEEGAGVSWTRRRALSRGGEAGLETSAAPSRLLSLARHPCLESEDSWGGCKGEMQAVS